MKFLFRNGAIAKSVLRKLKRFNRRDLGKMRAFMTFLSSPTRVDSQMRYDPFAEDRCQRKAIFCAIALAKNENAFHSDHSARKARTRGQS
jgi:hypothetical protein